MEMVGPHCMYNYDFTTLVGLRTHKPLTHFSSKPGSSRTLLIITFSADDLSRSNRRNNASGKLYFFRHNCPSCDRLHPDCWQDLAKDARTVVVEAKKGVFKPHLQMVFSLI